MPLRWAPRAALVALLVLVSFLRSAGFVINVSDRVACPADIVIVQWDREQESIIPGRDRLGLYPVRDIPTLRESEDEEPEEPSPQPEPQHGDDDGAPAEPEPPDSGAGEAAADGAQAGALDAYDATLSEPVLEFGIGAEYVALPGATFWTNVGLREGRFEFRAVRAPEAAGGLPTVLARSPLISVRNAHCLRLTLDARDVCISEPVGVRWSVPLGTWSDKDVIRLVDVTPGRGDAREVFSVHAALLPEDAAGPVRSRQVFRGPSEPGLYEARYYREPVAGGPDAAWIMRSRPFVVRLKAGCGRPPVPTHRPSQAGVLDPYRAASRAPSGALAAPAGPFPESQDLIGAVPLAMQPEYGVTWPHTELLPLPPRAFALSLWLYVSGDGAGPGGFGSVLFKGTGNCCRTPSLWVVAGTRQLLAQVSLDDGNYVGLYSEARLPLHAWVHVALVLDSPRDGPALRLYVDGRPDGLARVPAGRAVAVNEGPLNLGKNLNVDGFRGLLARVRIFLRALSPAEVAASFAAERAERPSPFAEACGAPNSTAYLASARASAPALGPQGAGDSAVDVPGNDARGPDAACGAGLDYLWDREGDMDLLAPAAARLLERCACGGAGEAHGHGAPAGRALWSWALLHAAGLGLPRSASTAALLYQWAATHGEAAAQMALAYRSLGAFGGTNDAEAAAYYYHVAAQKAQGHRHGGGGGTAIDGNWLKDVHRGKLAEGQKGEDDGVIQYEKYKADGGDVAAMMNVARWYYFGERGLKQDLERAYQYFASAAETGHTGAQTMLAQMEVKGEGCAKDYASAFERFAKSAATGDTEAMNGLAYMHMYGLHVPQDYKKALAEFDRAAVKGNANAIFNAAAMYRGGVGTADGKANLDTAWYYMEVVAKAGHVDAIFHTGVMLLAAEGRSRSPAAAVPRLARAAAFGPWSRAIRDGFDAYLDYKEGRALLHYSAAAEMGYPVAMANAAWMLDRFAGPARVAGRHARARELNERALGEGHAHLHLPLGDYHYYGRGAAEPPEEGGTGSGPDKARALEHYRAASAAGVRQATFNLAQMYHGGDGVGRNLSAARALYRRAVADGSPEAGPPIAAWLVRAALAQLWLQERIASLLEGLGVQRWAEAAGVQAGGVRVDPDAALIGGLAAALVLLLALRPRRR